MTESTKTFTKVIANRNISARFPAANLGLLYYLYSIHFQYPAYLDWIVGAILVMVAIAILLSRHLEVEVDIFAKDR